LQKTEEKEFNEDTRLTATDRYYGEAITKRFITTFKGSAAGVVRNNIKLFFSPHFSVSLYLHQTRQLFSIILIDNTN